jgi:hypothetical protein
VDLLHSEKKKMPLGVLSAIVIGGLTANVMVAKGGDPKKDNLKLFANVVLDAIADFDDQRFMLYLFHASKRREIFDEKAYERVLSALKKNMKVGTVYVDDYPSNINLIPITPAGGRYTFDGLVGSPKVTENAIAIDLCPNTINQSVVNAYYHFITTYNSPVYILDQQHGVAFRVDASLLRYDISDKDELKQKQVRFGDVDVRNFYLPEISSRMRPTGDRPSGSTPLTDEEIRAKKSERINLAYEKFHAAREKLERLDPNDPNYEEDRLMLELEIKRQLATISQK